MKPTISILILCVLLAGAVRPAGAQSAKQIQQIQARQRMEEAVQKRAQAEQRRHEGNLRTLCVILNDQEIRKKLKVTSKQDEQLEELDKKLDELREKTINPEGKKMTPVERSEAVKAKIDDLRELSLKAGKAVAEILTRDQVNAFGRHTDQERAKRAWEKRMGIEPPPKPEKKDEKPKAEKKP